MKKNFSRTLSLFVVLILTINMKVPVKAENKEQLVTPQEISNFLDNCENTQEIIITEKEALQIMCQSQEGRNQLNDDLRNLSQKPINELRQKGMRDKEIEIVKNYSGEQEDLNTFINTYASNVVFNLRFGLAGSDIDKRKTRIAYEGKWSKDPLSASLSSLQIAVAWTMADASSYYLSSKNNYISDCSARYAYTNGSYSRTDYFTPTTNLYDDNRYVADTKPGTLYSGEYLQAISGLIETSTQSDSYNMQTIKVAVAVAYPTYTASISPSLNFPLPGFKIDSGSFGITIERTMKELGSGIRTFRYYESDSRYHYVNDFPIN